MAGGAGDAADARGDVRDHRGQRRLAGTGPARSPTAWPPSIPAWSGSSTTRSTAGTAARFAPGFETARYELLAFTDGDRQFRVADIGRLTARLAEADQPDVVVGYRIKRADPVDPDRLRPDVQARQPDLLRPPGTGRRLRLQAVPPRGARGRARRVRRGVLLGRAADQDHRAGAIHRRGRRAPLRAHRRARPPAPGSA